MTKIETANAQRVAWAREAVATYETKREDFDTAFRDVLSDLGHLADAESLDYPRMLARALAIWTSEKLDARSIEPEPHVVILIAGHVAGLSEGLTDPDWSRHVEQVKAEQEAT